MLTNITLAMSVLTAMLQCFSAMILYITFMVTSFHRHVTSHDCVIDF